ncbi:MAG TPA: hypothetical protein PK493_02400 [Pseudomonadota bacterium]|nr:hypothetical protein [Pseudomonadota bacterium]
MILQLSALTSVAQSLALRIVVEGGCPEPAAVMSHLRLIDSSLIDRDATARLEPIDDKLRVELRSGDGALLVVQDLLLGPSCDTLAAAASVVIATALGSAKSGELPLYGPIPIPLPPLPARVPMSPRPLSLELGLSVGLEPSWPRPGGGGFGLLQLAPTKAGWNRLGAVVLVGGTSLKQQAFLQGSVDFTRLQLAVGPRLRLSVGSWLFDLFATVSPALTLVYGRDFPSTFASQGFDLGLGGGVRAMAKLGALLPFVMLHASGFVREQRLHVLGADATAALAPYSVQLGLGLSWLALP